jgi:chorismate mutase/GNAT superfamily N-acetyltransferase
MPTDLSLRHAGADDLPHVAEVYLAARHEAPMPPPVHTDDEVRSWVRSWDLAEREVWLAETDGALAGFANLTSTWLDGLYVVPGAQRHGVGTALVELAKSLRPRGLGLWVFEVNQPARAFYRRHGFVELDRTDGAGNEENAPDLRMVWPGADPLACYRSLIDEVDDALGELLARRTALTRVVQEHKRAVSAAPDPARDAQREAEIVSRVAALAPELGRDRVERIVHAIITESIAASLDATRDGT